MSGDTLYYKQKYEDETEHSRYWQELAESNVGLIEDQYAIMEDQRAVIEAYKQWFKEREHFVSPVQFPHARAVSGEEPVDL